MALIPKLTKRPAPPDLQEILDNLPPTWVDDGLSNFPDSVLGFDISEAGTGHDFFIVAGVGRQEQWIRNTETKAIERLAIGSGPYSRLA